MSWVITGSEKTPVDPQFGSVSLLLHGNGTNGSTTITDSSLTPKTVTAVGNAQISTAQSKFGGASIAFDGTGDEARLSNSNEFTLAGNFTIECWIYFNILTNSPSVFCLGSIISPNNGLLLYWSNSTTSLRVYSNGASLITSVGTAAATTWQHMAVVRNGSGTNNLSLYVDGVLRGQATNSTVFSGVSANGFVLGSEYANSFFPSLNGYIDDLRITKGVARYTANFTPPTAPFPDI
jgi:hypothetical protein